MPATQILEVRSYRIRHGHREEFAARLREQILPMFKRHGIEVVYFGPSLADEDSFCLLRTYPSIEERQTRLDAFYGSAEWMIEHEEDWLEMAETMTTCVLAADEQLIEAMKTGLAKAAEPHVIQHGSE
jgi:hypothetical protein